MDEWQERVLDKVYQGLTSKRNAEPPDYDKFRSAVATAWAGVVQGVEWRFFTGIQAAMLPGLHFDFMEDADNEALLDWDENMVDGRGQPVTLYDPAFEKRFLELLVEYDIYESVERAGLYLGLADRHCKRGEWMGFLMAEMWLELPVLAEQEIRDFHERRRGEGQLSLLAALGWQ